MSKYVLAASVSLLDSVRVHLAFEGNTEDEAKEAFLELVNAVDQNRKELEALRGQNGADVFLRPCDVLLVVGGSVRAKS